MWIKGVGYIAGSLISLFVINQWISQYPVLLLADNKTITTEDTSQEQDEAHLDEKKSSISETNKVNTDKLKHEDNQTDSEMKMNPSQITDEPDSKTNANTLKNDKYIIWQAFSSKQKAETFAQFIEKKSTIPVFVQKKSNGFNLYINYSHDEDKHSQLKQIEAFTGYKIKTSSLVWD